MVLDRVGGVTHCFQIRAPASPPKIPQEAQCVFKGSASRKEASVIG
jgi:hypothetical protein